MDDLLQGRHRLGAQLLVLDQHAVLQGLDIARPGILVLDQAGQADIGVAHKFPHVDMAPVDGVVDKVVDQFLLGAGLPLGELVVPGHRDIDGVARQEQHRLVPQRVVRRADRQQLAHLALVTVVAVGGGQPGYLGNLAGEFVGIDQLRLGQVVAQLVEP